MSIIYLMRAHGGNGRVAEITSRTKYGFVCRFLQMRDVTTSKTNIYRIWEFTLEPDRFYEIVERQSARRGDVRKIVSTAGGVITEIDDKDLPF